MKQVLLIMAATAIGLASCNNSDRSTSSHENQGAGEATSESPTQPSEEAKVIQPTFASLETGVSSHINALFEHYVHIKTALVGSNAAEAKSGAEALLQALKGFDRSLLSAEQKEAYNKNVPGIRSATEGIAKSSDIKKQREYFAQLSTNAYGLAKSFGGGQTLYHDHCPMAFDKKGAMWLSEQKEIKNPYYGEEMMECGTVEEVIQKP